MSKNVVCEVIGQAVCGCSDSAWDVGAHGNHRLGGEDVQCDRLEDWLGVRSGWPHA